MAGNFGGECTHHALYFANAPAIWDFDISPSYHHTTQQEMERRKINLHRRSRLNEILVTVLGMSK